jgi:hypothetical protein
VFIPCLKLLCLSPPQFTFSIWYICIRFVFLWTPVNSVSFCETWGWVFRSYRDILNNIRGTDSRRFGKNVPPPFWIAKESQNPWNWQTQNTETHDHTSVKTSKFLRLDAIVYVLVALNTNTENTRVL